MEKSLPVERAAGVGMGERETFAAHCHPAGDGKAPKISPEKGKALGEDLSWRRESPEKQALGFFFVNSVVFLFLKIFLFMYTNDLSACMLVY